MSWPSGVPGDFLVTGFSYAPISTQLRTKMGTGLSKQRNRYTIAPWLLQGDIIVTTAEKLILDDWIKNDLLNGSESFEKVDPLNALHTYSWRFKQSLTYVPFGCDWKTTIVLYRLPERIIAEDGGFGLVDAAGNHLVDSSSDWLGA